MTVFYEGPRARITHKVFEAHFPRYRSFVISEIRHLYVAERPAAGSSATDDRALSRNGSAGAAVGIAMVALIAWPILHAAPISPVVRAGLAATLVVAVVCAVAFAAYLWLRPWRVHELWAVYQGRMTCLFETTDERVFGQVRRALVRAVEQLEDNGAKL